jgi:hypothetical protein
VARPTTLFNISRCKKAFQSEHLGPDDNPLNAYFLSRELLQHVGVNGRFHTVRDHRDFEGALDLHCREASPIINYPVGSPTDASPFWTVSTTPKASQMEYPVRVVADGRQADGRKLNRESISAS